MADHGRTALVWDGEIEYDFGPDHPLQPIRVELTVDLIRELGICDGEQRVEVPSGDYDEGELLRIHEREYVEVVKQVSADPASGPAMRFGLGPGDTPIFPRMHEASIDVCAASKEAARQVIDGESLHAFNPAGGLHHAMPARGAGFCVYNDPAAAIDHMLRNGVERIAYIDVDVHHGDGVERIFWDDPRVLTISVHESGRYLFPGTGFPTDIGGDGAEGSAANLPLHPGTTGDIWMTVFDEAVEPLVHAFGPEVLVTQLGCDTHATDPLAHLALTTDDYAQMAARMHRLAHEAADGRWVATGGGGYKLVEVVPRAWTIWFAEMAGFELPDETPEAWREAAQERSGRRPPRRFGDGHIEIGRGMHESAKQAARRAVEAVHDNVLSRH